MWYLMTVGVQLFPCGVLVMHLKSTTDSVMSMKVLSLALAASIPCELQHRRASLLLDIHRHRLILPLRTQTFVTANT